MPRMSSVRRSARSSAFHHLYPSGLSTQLATTPEVPVIYEILSERFGNEAKNG